jgi:iron complex transport system ATP-binding protein
LALHDLHVKRGNTLVLSHVSLLAPSGAITALIGPNGAGKSSIIAAILGLLPVESGSIRLHGVDVLRLERMQRARSFGYVPQRTQLMAPMPVTQVVGMGLYAHGHHWFGPVTHSAAIKDALQQVDAEHLSKRLFNELSAGEAQRILVARALAGGARTLLLDEPTSSLDIGHALELLALLQRLAHTGHTIVIALHQLDDVQRVADHAVLMHNGIVLNHGQPSAVLGSSHIATAFGVVREENTGIAFRLTEGRT